MKYDKEIKILKEFKTTLQKYIDRSIEENGSVIYIQTSKNGMDLPSLKKRLNTLIGQIENFDVPHRPNEFSNYDLSFHDIFKDSINNLRHHIDSLEQVIANYQYHQNEFKLKRFNPIYWIGEFVRIPFHLFSFAGFDINKIEFSLFGKLWKLIISVLIVLAALAGILNYCEIELSDIF